MNKQKIVVCDRDEDYVSAFVSYLVQKKGKLFHISSFTDPEIYRKHAGEYDIGLLGEDFLVLGDAPSNIAYPLYLCEEMIAPEFEHMTQVFKYQSMEDILEILMEFRKFQNSDAEKVRRGGPRIIGIYSPITHELQMPYALTLAQILAEDKRTLFVDLEDISLLKEYTQEPLRGSLYDFFYCMEAGRWDTNGQSSGYENEVDFGKEKEGGVNMASFIGNFRGLDYLPGFESIDQMSAIEESQWHTFLEWVLKEEYEVVVLLFGRVLPGFRELLGACDQILLLSKPGEYYEKCQWIAWQFLQEIQLQRRAMDVSLPMSAMNLTIGTYLMEELCQGNMGRFIRRQITAGDIVAEEI